VVHDAQKIHSKLENHGETCIFVGYADNHVGNVYRMFNLQTQHVWTMRDVKWIWNSTGNEEMPQRVNPSITDDVLLDVEKVLVVETIPDEEEEEEIDHGAPADDKDNTNDDAGNKASLEDEEEVNPHILHQMKKLGVWFNPATKQYIDQANTTTKDSEVNDDHDDDSSDGTSKVGREVANAMLSHVPSKFAFYSAMKAIEKLTKDNEEMHHFVELTTFHEAYNHPDPVQHQKWHVAIQKEFCNMTNCDVWHKVK